MKERQVNQMSNSVYKLYTELEKVRIPDGFEVSFGFHKSSELGKSGWIRITVTETATGEKLAWVVSPKELENAKMDFVKDHIEALIDQLWEDE